MDKLLILLVGLPRSGKSTWAKSFVHPVVNRDAIRLAVHGQAFILEAEDLITCLEDLMVKTLFRTGYDTVIVDATHVTAKRRQRWYDLMKKEDIPITWQVMATPETICILRAKEDGREDLIPVINKMALEWDVPGYQNIHNKCC